MKFRENHFFHLQVQFEDVDSGLAVHHPRYLCYLERARCAGMRDAEYPFAQMLANGQAFVVAEVNSSYKKSLKIDEKIVVITRLVAAKKSSVKVTQAVVLETVFNGFSQQQRQSQDWQELTSEAVYLATMRLVCVDLKLAKPMEIPLDLKRVLLFPDPSLFALNPEWSQTALP